MQYATVIFIRSTQQYATVFNSMQQYATVCNSHMQSTCHVCCLGGLEACLVQARGAPRQNATAKDSEWVRTRQALEKDKPSDVNEVLLGQELACNLTLTS